MIRFLASMTIEQPYNLEVIGMRNIPEKDGVLMLNNYISWIDWAIVQMTCPHPIRFVMEKSIYQCWYLPRFLDFFDIVPISSDASKGAIETMSKLLNNGEVVCLFPGGSISHFGQLWKFRRGYEKAAAESNGIILPFYLGGFWGSWFLRSSDKLKSISDSGIKRDIIVTFGPALSMHIKSEELKKNRYSIFQLTPGNFIQIA